MISRIICVGAAMGLAGCVSTAKTIVTTPFRVVGKAADWTTTSQSESDRNRGRALRKAEEKARRDCKHEAEGDQAREACVRDRLRRNGFS
jgi:hypothetical protein